MFVFRTLQFAAFRSIQLAPTIQDITARGRAIVDAIYTEPYDRPAAEPQLPPRTLALRWPHPTTVLQQIDLAELVEAAERAGVVIELTVISGGTLRQGGIVAHVRGSEQPVDARVVLDCFATGLERTFDQDPRFAFRLLVDIALRALSAAVNDPATAVQVLDAVDSLLLALAPRRLDIGRILGPEGDVRVVLPLPSWEDYVTLAIDEVAQSAATVPTVVARIDRLLEDIAADAPDDRRHALLRRRHGSEVLGR
jgi:uncharacterized membrane protein